MSEKVRVIRSNEEGPTEKVHGRRSVEEGGEGPMKKERPSR